MDKPPKFGVEIEHITIKSHLNNENNPNFEISFFEFNLKTFKKKEGYQAARNHQISTYGQYFENTSKI